MSVNEKKKQEAQKWGIRVRRAGRPSDPWQRGKQFRRDDDAESGWVYWRNEWPNKKAAELRLAQYKKMGYIGHPFPIKQPIPEVQYPTKTHYSPNFTRAELECKCGCTPSAVVERNLTELATHLEQMREELGGKPLGILSGHRCAAYNKKIGGASQSRHLTGEAADLAVPWGKQDTFYRAALRVPAFKGGGIGLYPGGGLHVDHRGYVARWDDWVRQ